MSLDLLLLSFQAGMFAQRGELNLCVKRWAAQKITGRKLEKTMADSLAVAVHDALRGVNRNQNLASLLGWNHLSVCLPLAGGASRSDALYLLDLLWQDRKSFVVIGTNNLSPRCLAILFVLWQSLIRMGM